MFIWSFRLTPFKVVACLLAVALVGVLGITGMQVFNGRSSVTANAPEAVQAAKPGKVAAKTNQQRLDFVRSFGWEVKEEPIEILEVIIPQEFDQVYREYNSVQKEQGYDLEKFAGKRVKRYSYAVTNYPGETGEVRINLLVKDNKVIGGDVCSMTPEGFTHGFVKS